MVWDHGTSVRGAVGPVCEQPLAGTGPVGNHSSGRTAELVRNFRTVQAEILSSPLATVRRRGSIASSLISASSTCRRDSALRESAVGLSPSSNSIFSTRLEKAKPRVMDQQAVHHFAGQPHECGFFFVIQVIAVPQAPNYKCPRGRAHLRWRSAAGYGSGARPSS